MSKVIKSKIVLNVELDENRVPEKLNWSAQDGAVNNEEAKAVMLSVWDSKSQETLNKLSGVFKEYSDTNILVVGHTDSTGDANYNMELSKKRAYSVTNYLKNKGVNSYRLTTNWFGETQPVHDNTTSEGRAKNRRVNIAILPNEEMIEDAKKQAGQ